jgi:prephenate dehydrogenase
MISTMLQIKEATEEALFDTELMSLAQFMFHSREHMEAEEFAQLLFKYSTSLSALTATLVSQVCLSESDMSEMIATMKEMNQLTEELDN